MRKHNQSMISKATPEKRTHRKVHQHMPPTKWQDSFINASLDDMELDSQLTNQTHQQSSAQKGARHRQNKSFGLNRTQALGGGPLKSNHVPNVSVYASIQEPRSDS